MGAEEGRGCFSGGNKGEVEPSGLDANRTYPEAGCTLPGSPKE